VGIQRWLPVLVATLAFLPPAQEPTSWVRALEQAYDAEDSARAEQLLRAHTSEIVPVFERYARVWLEPHHVESERERALTRARALAESAEEAVLPPRKMVNSDRR
jgi:hypothetical protein